MTGRGPASAPQLLAAKQVAERLGCSVSWARDLMASGQFEVVRVAAHVVRVREDALEQFIASKTVPAVSSRVIRGGFQHGRVSA